LFNVLVDNNEIETAIISTDIDNLDLLPSSIDLVGAEIELVNRESREFVLDTHLQKVKDRYDYIIIDCLPSLGLLTINSLTAADSV